VKRAAAAAGGGEAGYITVVAAVSAVAVIAAGVGVAGLAGVVASRHAVATAADLAALAGASVATAYLPQDPCSAARRVAALSGAALTSCAVTPEGEVTVRLRRRVGTTPMTVAAVARAGPAPRATQ
jgi:secretion/DNA translocation related TadE-like protein